MPSSDTLASASIGANTADALAAKKVAHTWLDGYPSGAIQSATWDYYSTVVGDEYEEALINLSIAQLECLSIDDKTKLKSLVYSIDAFRALSSTRIEAILGHPLKCKINAPSVIAIAQKAKQAIDNYGIRYAIYGTQLYPKGLIQGINPPYMLFWRGNIKALSKPSVSIVGTRKCTKEGRDATIDFASKAVKEGYCIVSGLALGVDTISHKTALEVAFSNNIDSGVTVAVLPSGLDIITPALNKSLVRSIIASNGCIVSEYIPGTIPIAYRFGLRNRIIAGLSPVTIVTQAPVGSGALITARYAIQLGRGLCIYSLCYSAKARELDGQILSSLSSNQLASPKYKRCVANFLNTKAHIIASYEDYKVLFPLDIGGI